jgi:hypothetical protein
VSFVCTWSSIHIETINQIRGERTYENAVVLGLPATRAADAAHKLLAEVHGVGAVDKGIHARVGHGHHEERVLDPAFDLGGALPVEHVPAGTHTYQLINTPTRKHISARRLPGSRLGLRVVEENKGRLSCDRKRFAPRLIKVDSTGAYLWWGRKASPRGFITARVGPKMQISKGVCQSARVMSSDDGLLVQTTLLMNLKGSDIFQRWNIAHALSEFSHTCLHARQFHPLIKKY